jgi:hypothetical protein
MMLANAVDDPYSMLKAAHTNPLSVASEDEDSCGTKGFKSAL